MDFIPLTLNDVIFAAIWAFALVFIIRTVSRMFLRLVTRTTVLSLRPDQLEPEQLDAFLNKCYMLFPIDSFRWEGITFRRGNTLRIITSNNTAIEGRFIGINSDDMVCLMTNHSVVAQEIHTIEDVQNLT